MNATLIRPVLGYLGVLGMACLLMWILVQPARAQTATTRIQEAQTQLGQTSAQRIAQAHSRLDANDLLVAQIWGLSEDEMIRAKVLLKGPRAAFSVENEELLPFEHAPQALVLDPELLDIGSHVRFLLVDVKGKSE